MKVSKEEFSQVFDSVQKILDEKIPQDELKIIFKILTELKKERYQTLGVDVIEKDSKTILFCKIKDCIIEKKIRSKKGYVCFNLIEEKAFVYLEKYEERVIEKKRLNKRKKMIENRLKKRNSI